MMPMARPSQRHGIAWALPGSGFVRVAGSTNQVRRMRAA